MGLATLPRLRWEIRSLAGCYPAVFLPLARRRYRPGHFQIPLGPHTELVIEGFPRTGTTFAFTAFELAQQKAVSVAHHTHVPAQVMAGVQRGIPVLVLIRPPEETILSLAIRLPYLHLRQALRSYLRFYRPLLEFRSGLVVGPFHAVVTDFGRVIRRLNERFGTAFTEFQHTRENVRRCLDRIEEGDRRNFGVGIELERAAGRPSTVREGLKEALRQRYRAEDLKALAGLADQAYSEFTAGP